MEQVDVAIVGGGPGGLAAAHAAASGGAEACVFERGVPRADRASPGPDSTDAAGMLDYWVDLMGIPFEEIPDDIILRELEGTKFYGPTANCTLYSTGIESSYPKFGFTFDRVGMDDWLKERAEEAGAEYRIGVRVKDVRTKDGQHTIELGDGTEIVAQTLILADGPQRTVTMRVLDRFLPSDRPIGSILGPDRANHIAYQEHREFPAELFDPEMLKFWWGHIPGETAYPWIFPNDGTIARVGLTMPIGQKIEDITDRDTYPLLRADDDRIPSGSEFIRRLLDQLYGDTYDVESDFPLVANRGKRGGIESYAISSTLPIDSPTKANIAVVGGAMGTTSAFHEGGYHLAVRSGTIAGRLATKSSLEQYNQTWKREIGDEILRNVAMAKLVKPFTPADWDRHIRIADRMLADQQGYGLLRRKFSAGIGATKLLLSYKYAKYTYRNGRYVQLTEKDYRYRTN